MVRTADRVVRSPRLAARRREVRAQQRRRRRRIVLAVVLLGGIGYGAWALTHSSVFSLQRIDVVGATTVPRAAIVEASGLRIGQNALGIDVRAVASRIKAVPGVADARVRRTGSLGITIEITERVAAIEVRAGETQWLLDQGGVQIADSHRGSKAIPTILLPPGATITSVSPVDEQGVLSLWTAMSADMRSSVPGFSLAPDHTLTFRLATTVVVFGSPDQIDAKVRAIQMVAARVAADHHRLVRIDVTAPARPAARVS